MSKDVAFSPVSTIIPRSPPDDTLHRRHPRRRRQTDSAVLLNQTIDAPQRDPHRIQARRSVVNASSWVATAEDNLAPASYTLTTSPLSSPRLNQVESSSLSSSSLVYPWRRQRSQRHSDDPHSDPDPAHDNNYFHNTNSKPETKTHSRQTVMFAADPRDAGRATTLKSASTSDSPSAPAATTITTTTTTTTSPSSSSSYPHASSSSVPRLPQSRFSFEYQIPLHKRALTSSHGTFPIEPTSSADPSPTPQQQRTFLYDRPWRAVPGFSLSRPRDPTASATSSHLPSPLSFSEESSDLAWPFDADSTNNALNSNASKRRRKKSLSQYQQPNIQADVKGRMPSATTPYVQGNPLAEERDRAINRVDLSDLEDGARTPLAEDPRSKNEDIFLNIARSDSKRRDSLGRSELRRSRLGLSGSHLRSPTSRFNEQTPSPDHQQLNTYETPLHSHHTSPSNPYSALPYSYSASAHPLDDHSRSRHSVIGSSSRSTIGLPRSRFNRTSPDDSPQSPEIPIERRGSLQDPRAYRHSALASIRSSRQPSGSDVTERARVEPDRSRQDGTESTLSTTAPSTVWDELEDLKSRIKKLELTGKLPPSSQAAISSVSGERPRTATTTVTTVSSSPKHNHKTSNLSGDSENVANPVHPLLHSALLKAKTVLSNEVFKALDAAVTDALALSNTLGTNQAPSGGVSCVNGYSPSDRQNRRKADSVCRSLTELCIALSDVQPPQQQQASSGDDDTITQLHVSTNGEAPTPALPFRRSTIQAPEDIGLGRRKSITNRLEARRASLAAATHTSSKDQSPVADGSNTQLPGGSAPRSRLNRLSTTLRTKRLQPDEDNGDEPNPHSRSFSRAMTDMDNPRPIKRFPTRERTGVYTASQTAPDTPRDQSSRLSYQSPRTQLRTPTVQSSIPLRRSLVPPGSFTPATSRSNILAGSRRYGAPDHAATPSGIPMPPSPGENVHSQTRISVSSSKQAASYTPIQQNRIRANSMGVRAFGLRHRPMATYDDAASSVNVSID
ncbi:putative LPXTG-motif cell wall anchor domain protein [Aspergillus clavatus NRRL 1]|uniref:LPXTG-motif cell wall anchor domain protein, putative n=1 Tax=Aspergillus clavatus (strain ATCC 1007 / CBS 513.65 / DSM 816 / NCTC 3887 / NRRL 1 / QM 1276 / 107) TaxID=344612 RepID=A1CF55_ASPCL|nr:LPXTG-motif cell wall anchor domain protein, putative [Aspergillus clavatus NRRL 1]EAW11504.1 LPXTG-motif cell wall anchor domain protein, putative [Aspergillus clavatus NRRL 1]